MSDSQKIEVSSQGSPKPVDLSSATIRAQLLWASLFPLVFFGMLCILAISSTFNAIMLALVTQRNTAQVQVIAGVLAQDSSPSLIRTSSSLSATLETINPVGGSSLFLVDTKGIPLSSADERSGPLPIDNAEFQLLTQKWKPTSQLMESITSNEQVMISFAPIRGGNLGVLLVEPWKRVMAPAVNNQLVLAGLLGLGIVLSLGMLSLSISRIIRPITTLAENASGAVPGSVFHPIPEYGPSEMRALINAFNLMVIRLAEQQTALRQYAHIALLSQEEERLRLSHELHDGTVQDLVGLTQRVELCRNELESNPASARLRLDELNKLLEKTLDDVRHISIALRPPVLEDFGLSVAVDNICKDLKLEKPSLDVKFSVLGVARRLNSDLELAVYRVVQEAITNIRKHAPNANSVQVELTFGESEIQAVVKNNGTSFVNKDVNSFVRSGHIGLAGMYERARLFDGNLSITSDPNENTIITLKMPASQDSSDNQI